MSVESTLTAAFAPWFGAVEVVSHTATPWHSATFSGTHHTFTLITNYAGDIPILAQEITETDIPIPGGFVADVAVSACPTGNARRLNVDVLTIDA